MKYRKVSKKGRKKGKEAGETDEKKRSALSPALFGSPYPAQTVCSSSLLFSSEGCFRASLLFFISAAQFVFLLSPLCVLSF